MGWRVYRVVLQRSNFRAGALLSGHLYVTSEYFHHAIDMTQKKKTQTHAKVILVYNLPTNEQMKYLTKFATVGRAKRG